MSDLFAVAALGDVELVQLELQSSISEIMGFNPDTYRDGIGRTALHVACCSGHLDVAGILLENRSDKHSVTQDGDTPLHLACVFEHSDIVAFLLRAKADVNLKNVRGETALHCAIRADDPDIVEQLLEENVDKSVVCQGQAYVDYACDLRSHRSIELLLDSGFAANGEPTSRMTPLHYATRKGDVQIVELLLRRGADVNIISQYKGKYLLPVQMSRKKPVRMCFQKHFMKLEAADFCLSDKNLTYIRTPNEELLVYKIYCDTELQSMKYRREIVPGVSWFDILWACDDNLEPYASDVTLVQLLDSYDFEVLDDEFPLYAFALEQSIREIYEKYILLAGEDALSRIPSFELPHVVTREVRDYLSREDLLSLINVIKIIEE